MKSNSLRRIFDVGARRRSLMAEIQEVRACGLFDAAVFSPFGGGGEGSGLPPEALYLQNADNWRAPVSALFDGAFYLRTNSDVAEAEVNPLLHYIRHGFFEGRSPSPLVDPQYIAGQLSKAEESEISDSQAAPIFSQYRGLRDLLLATGADPNPFFENRFYLERYPCRPGVLPLEEYCLRGGYDEEGQPLECSRRASLKFYIDQHPDLREAAVVPLRHLLEYGIYEERSVSDTGTVDRRFLTATSVLLGDPDLAKLPNFLRSSKAKDRLAGPTWPSEYSTLPLPSLAYVAQSEYEVCIGVVLFENTEAEVRRLVRSIEVSSRASAHKLRPMFFVNDGLPERYAGLIGEFEVYSSPENIGFGRAQNRLMCEAYSGSERVVYIGANPDGYFAPGCIDALVSMHEFCEGFALIEASTAPVEHPKWYDPIYLDTNWVSGACFLISRDLWRETRGFDEQIHLYGEDVDLSWRVKAVGGKLKVCPLARFVHDVTGRQYEVGDRRGALQRRISMLKGNYYLARKWGGVEPARRYFTELTTLLPKGELAGVTGPAEEVPTSIAQGVADFTQERFAFSRFW